MKTAVITGVNGQDGYYLTKLLLEKGYRVVGIQRRASTTTAWRLHDLPDTSNLVLEAGDITDLSSVLRVVKKYQPEEFYNLAAQSQVWHSFQSPLSTCEITGLGVLICLEAVRQEAPSCKFYQAGSSEQFGNSAIFGKERKDAEAIYERVLNIDSPMGPRSPYGAAKLFGHNMVRNYREAYDMFAVGGILFNHESPYRGTEFVTRKITHSLASVLVAEQDAIKLGNLDSYRDWGHAEDYMRAAWMMLQQDSPKDYVIATGETYSIREFLSLAFICAGISDWTPYVEQDANMIRPSEVDILIGDATLAHEELGWRPSHTFVSLVHSMVAKDLERKGVIDRLVAIEEVENQWNFLRS